MLDLAAIWPALLRRARQRRADPRLHSFVLPGWKPRVSTRRCDLAGSVAGLLDLSTHAVHSFVLHG